MSNSISLSGSCNFWVEFATVTITMFEGPTIVSVYSGVSEEGIVGALLVKSDDPIIHKFSEEGEEEGLDAEITDEDEAYYEEYCDTVSLFDGAFGPRIRSGK